MPDAPTLAMFPARMWRIMVKWAIQSSQPRHVVGQIELTAEIYKGDTLQMPEHNSQTKTAATRPDLSVFKLAAQQRAAAADVGKPSDGLAKLPPCPKDMTDEARPFYRHAGKLICQAGILSARDIPTLISYAEAQSELLVINRIIDVEGRFQQSAFGTKPHPALTERRHLQNLIRQYQAALGFGPASRLKVQPPVEESSSSVASRPQAKHA